MEHRLPDIYRFIRRGKNQQYVIKKELKHDQQQELKTSDLMQEQHKLLTEIDDENSFSAKKRKMSDC